MERESEKVYIYQNLTQHCKPTILQLKKKSLPSWSSHSSEGRQTKSKINKIYRMLDGYIYMEKN